MAIGHPQPVDVEEWREELRTVLQSPLFVHAPRLAHLLAHICEKRFAGEAHQIKEYSIGVEVFGRGPLFDQETDSIVRVEANRLRKRLADYYAGEGAQHRLRITIPVGQYVPEFRLAAAQAATRGGEARSAVAAEPVRAHMLRNPVWLAAGVVLTLLLAVGLWLAIRATHKPAASAPAVPAPDRPAASEALIGLPVGEEVRLLAGSPRSYVDHAGKLWSADVYFSGGRAVRSVARSIRRTQDVSLFQARRTGQFRYDIPLKSGLYELHLGFAADGPESNDTGREGSRLFTVRANGRTLLSHFDIYADAGGGGIADVRVFPGLSSGSDGALHLEFAGEEGGEAALSTIEIVPGAKGAMRPVRLLARPTPYYSNDSHWWSPDNYFDGGQMASYGEPVSGTDDPEMYETERWGNFSYAIPAAPGRYTVRLYFAVRHQGWNQEPAPGGEKEAVPVEHVFDVFCNGRAILENFDLRREARRTDVVVRTATGLEANAQGKLLFSFVPVRGYATVAGIEVLPEQGW